MNFKSQESTQKLNGSYYTPRWIAEYISKWAVSEEINSILEPSCGDGIFFDTLSDVSERRDIDITAVDIDETVAQICEVKLTNNQYENEVITGDFIDWSIRNFNANEPKTFDFVLGNPPFIRYQYMEKTLQNNSQALFNQLNVKFSKHTNAWIPFVLASLEFLNPGGRLGMVVPSEILHVLYAKELRKTLLNKCSRILLIDPTEIWFEGTLQGAMILMADKKEDENDCCQGIAIIKTNGEAFAQNNPEDLFENAHYVNGTFLENKWTYALLTEDELNAYNRILNHPSVHYFNEYANVDVGIVTGANAFFLVPQETVDKYDLQDVSHPMFGRSEHCKGIVYDLEQHQENIANGLPTNFLYFENEEAGQLHQNYIKLGEKEKLHERYKCRIRKPWYTVPSVYSTPISMLKRSNGMPRLILNSANAYTTDTAYRIKPNNNINATALVRCFLNSMTALSAELEGRHYGGGVLELVPSEIERLVVPYTENEFINLAELNDFVKQHTAEEILAIQDDLLFANLGIDMEDVTLVQQALTRLKNRRQRNNEPGA